MRSGKKKTKTLNEIWVLFLDWSIEYGNYPSSGKFTLVCWNGIASKVTRVLVYPRLKVFPECETFHVKFRIAL